MKRAMTKGRISGDQTGHAVLDRYGHVLYMSPESDIEFVKQRFCTVHLVVNPATDENWREVWAELEANGYEAREYVFCWM